MSETAPDQIPPTPADVTVAVPGMDNRTVVVNPGQVFVYAPSVVDTNDPRLRRLMERLAAQINRSLYTSPVSAPVVQPGSASADSGLVILPAPPA